MKDKTIDMNEVLENCQQLPERFNSLLMATVSPTGFPEASYAAYVKYEGSFYVYVSELAAHTRNMAHSGLAGVLFIEDEDKAVNLFARQRVTYQCTALEVARDSQAFEEIMSLFEAKFGEFINFLKQLQDFHLFRLTPQKGNFVQGFARAFTIEGDAMDQLRPINDRGHKTASNRSSSQSN
ncbi:pyridoxamine 5'-phosphate oxidase family protein [Methylicorpusculum oleiharenae]|uniref:HugZ family pyridoxamine 5'-phosphate oxidase n=1 Tax=Methylicorpusculum oleiharenae TaxID=1338687 RepID=UPI00135AC404|nr:pyridoxamine 5'-phosphate oxidase family protein [Methylicorpusculum oleiharenae]MCD2449888.1 pyridoxamine 5'-phosphate oxidase family protein [Methylicorpusculum oleiharenae]